MALSRAHDVLTRGNWEGAALCDIVAQAIEPYLAGLNKSATNITMVWLDNNDLAEKRVRVTVTTTWTPAVTFVLGGQTRTLSASSTMPIAH